MIWELLFRYALVMVVCALAIAIPDLGDIISLIGAMASSMLALILPPLIDQLILNNSSPKLFILKCIKNGGKFFNSPRKFPKFVMVRVGSRRLNWKFRENQDTELLLHSSYSFWPKLSTSGSGWDLASTLPWKKCGKLFLYFLLLFWILISDL